MNKHLRVLLALCLFAVASAPAAVRYVNVNSTSPTPPYTNWATAATTIQNAVDAVTSGDEILVTNGVYQTGTRSVDGTSNRVAVTKAVRVQSVNGPTVTSIVGSGSIGVVRCVYLTNDAFLAGFTLTSGANQFGGGVWCASSNAVVTNCLITGNSVYSSGGGAYGGTLNNCMLAINLAYDLGGGAAESTLNHCILEGNYSYYSGAGASGGILNNCILVGNMASIAGGGAFQATLNNCTLTDNTAHLFGSGGSGGGAANCTLNNCIVYYNTATSGTNYSGSVLNYSCTAPLPPAGTGNITDAPLFVNSNSWSNLRLQTNSPCINAGTSSPTIGGTDLDGRPRVIGGTMDIGAYEFQPGVSGEFIGWLAQAGLPTDGSADDADADSDLMNNWQEWIAGTVPTDAASALRLLNPTNTMSGVTVSWQSVANRTYSLERAANLGAAPPFLLLTSNLLGQLGTTSFVDTNATGNGPFFYRVGVQQ
jgi:hypothetical protein